MEGIILNGTKILKSNKNEVRYVTLRYVLLSVYIVFLKFFANIFIIFNKIKNESFIKLCSVIIHNTRYGVLCP